MKNCAALKFLAIILCAACLLSAAVSGVTVGILVAQELYSQTPEELFAANQYYDFRWQARKLAMKYEAGLHSNAEAWELDKYYSEYYTPVDNWSEDLWFYRLYDSQGTLVDGRYNAKKAEGMVKMTYDISAPQYPVILNRDIRVSNIPYSPEDPSTATQVPSETVDPTTCPTETTMPDPLSQYENAMLWEFVANGEEHLYLINTVSTGAEYGVELFLSPELLEMPDSWEWELLEFVYGLRYDLFWVLGGSLLLFAATLVYLCCAAGRKPKCAEVRPGGLNRLPLDLYLGGVIFMIVALVVLVEDSFYWLDNVEPLWLVFAAYGGLGYLCCLLVVGFLFAFAAQVKVPGAWWLKHTVVGFLLVLIWKICKWLVKGLDKVMTKFCKALPPLGKKLWAVLTACAAGLWKLTLWAWETFCKLVKWLFSLVKKGAELLWKGTRRFFQLLPHTWQWLVAAGALVVLAYLALFGSKLISLAAMCGGIGIILYSAHSFGILLEGSKRMRDGDLETKIDEKTLIGSFREHASHLNALADVATEAAKKQMKSERMKAELVTNVSHDIKTPLTSIINYVDLLQKAQSQEEAEAHLEVLQRQSQRLKKLIEDLMEMSKASTGNMAVELSTVDAVEAITQALGEFSEKLQAAQITPVFQAPEKPVMITADGRLTWRVLSNLLSNAVKYALPGTRLYIDLAEMDGKVLISLKNISREPLNVSSEELMERFVRGDASRNTEGSGLGLNIAQSLMDLQKGRLELLVDGDLFKATLIFPICS